jgi:hypothetical protein
MDPCRVPSQGTVPTKTVIVNGCKWLFVFPIAAIFLLAFIFEEKNTFCWRICLKYPFQ